MTAIYSLPPADAEFDESIYGLGGLCKNKHEWRSSGLSLRVRSNGKCVQCRREWYERNKEEQRRKARERMAARWADPVLAETMKAQARTPEAKAAKAELKIKYRSKLKEQGLTTHGTVPICRETPDYMKAIRAAGRLPSVA